MGLPIRDERRDNRVGEGVRCGACERPNGVGTDHERSTPARRPAASASRQPWEPDRQRHADRAMAVRGYRRRAALVLHRRRTPHRVADRCGHGSSQGDGVSVAARTVARRSSASITVAGVSRATPQMPNLMLLQGLFATLNSDTSGLLPSWMRGGEVVARKLNVVPVDPLRVPVSSQRRLPNVTPRATSQPTLYAEGIRIAAAP